MKTTRGWLEAEGHLVLKRNYYLNLHKTDYWRIRAKEKLWRTGYTEIRQLPFEPAARCTADCLYKAISLVKLRDKLKQTYRHSQTDRDRQSQTEEQTDRCTEWWEDRCTARRLTKPKILLCHGETISTQSSYKALHFDFLPPSDWFLNGVKSCCL